jgi:hypothetical protein
MKNRFQRETLLANATCTDTNWNTPLYAADLDGVADDEAAAANAVNSAAFTAAAKAINAAKAQGDIKNDDSDDSDDIDDSDDRWGSAG